jgi:methionine synthase II (cobalamin-independent)
MPPRSHHMFNAMKVDNYFLEYDNARAGTFAPLRCVPEGEFVVLGLLASKVSELESVDVLKRRIDEASRYVKLEQLALSPQCGFATSAADAPDLVTAAIAGRLPHGMGVARLADMPAEWSRQHQMLGLPSA